MSEKKIGRYEIKSELGRGGMATVYLAYDPVLERDVALKLLPNYFAHDPEFSARFEREAKTVAALEHGSIVSMYDYGEDGQWPYFVMRLMKGGSLKDRIEDGPMRLEEAARIVSRVAGALDKAHSKDIVHRDLKPGNIMFDEDGMAYLGDFGIVKLAESSESYTRTGNTLGTPAYMSPEQADGKPDIDGRSDIYSLGIILYEMLTGTAPYTHESMPRLLIMHLTAPIPNVLAARADLPAGIQAVIEKAMAKNRDERYATAGEMAEAVQAVLNGQKTAVTPEPAPVVETESEPKPEPAPTRAAPVVAVEPEPKVETAAAQPAPAVPPKRDPVPPPAAKPAPTPPAAAKSGGIPKWIYAAAGVVVIAIIAVIALSGGGDDPGDEVEEPVAADVGSEEAVVETAPTIAPATAVPATDVPTVEPTPLEPTEVPTEVPVEEPEAPIVQEFDPSFNYFDDPDLWETIVTAENDEWNFDRGQVTAFMTDPGINMAFYSEPFGEGLYEVDVTIPEADDLTTAVGIVVLIDEETFDWYEMILDEEGGILVTFCKVGCEEFEWNPIGEWFYDEAVNVGAGAKNHLGMEVVDGEINLYVNDKLVGTVPEIEHESGFMGLSLQNNAAQKVTAVFENFTYTPY